MALMQGVYRVSTKPVNVTPHHPTKRHLKVATLSEQDLKPKASEDKSRTAQQNFG
jgi:hypothetical protein